MIRKETDSDYSAISDTDPTLSSLDNTANGKTMLSREHILRTCRIEGRAAMLPIVIVMLAICVLSPIFIAPTPGTFGGYAILLLWLIGIITVTIQLSAVRKNQQAIREALPSGNFMIYPARTWRGRRYSCRVRIDGKVRRAPSSAIGQLRLLGEEDVYILMINDKIAALYPTKQFTLDADLLGKMSVMHPLPGSQR